MLFFTGYVALGASSILKEQDEPAEGKMTPPWSTNLDYVKDLGLRSV